MQEGILPEIIIFAVQKRKKQNIQMSDIKYNKGILIVNMGGPLNQSEMKLFLVKMFNDSHILPFNILARKALAFIISNARYKKSWKKYELIGGTPLVNTTLQMVSRLGEMLPESKVKYAFSYSKPFISEVLQTFENEGIHQVQIIPQYPHYSYTTYQSVVDDCMKFGKAHPKMQLSISPPYYKHQLFVEFWKDLIIKHKQIHKLQNPLLLFSAHSIPYSFVEKGDTYPREIEESAKLIATVAGCRYRVSFQSQIKGSKWVGPPTPEIMEELKQKGEQELVLIPISFVTENLETLYDMDIDLVPMAREKLHFPHASRVHLDFDKDTYIQLLKELSQNRN